jgi:hypothetical protein
MSNLLEELTYKNYQELAARVAQEFFPVGTLVYGCGWTYDFGIVKSISKTGKITVQKGNLPLEKVTDNEGTGGTYAKLWYRGNIAEFILPNEEDLDMSCQTSRTRFSPRCYLGKDWKEKGRDAPIEWTQTVGNRMLILAKPEINEKGLIMCEHYSD